MPPDDHIVRRGVFSTRKRGEQGIVSSSPLGTKLYLDHVGSIYWFCRTSHSPTSTCPYYNIDRSRRLDISTFITNLFANILERILSDTTVSSMLSGPFKYHFHLSYFFQNQNYEQVFALSVPLLHDKGTRAS